MGTVGSGYAYRAIAASARALAYELVVADAAYVVDPRLVRLTIADALMQTHSHVICLADRKGARQIANFLQVVATLRAEADAQQNDVGAQAAP